jgi:hypothetical protein
MKLRQSRNVGAAGGGSDRAGAKTDFGTPRTINFLVRSERRESHQLGREASMQIRHISPRSAEWIDALYDGGGRGWDKLAPEEKARLRHQREEKTATMESEGYGAGRERESLSAPGAQSASR